MTSEHSAPEAFFQAMCTRYRDLTGVLPADASDLGLRMRVLAHQLSALAGRAERAWADRFPQTAVGEALDLLAEERGLLRKPAMAAAGTLRFGRSVAGAAVTIPAGTLCATREGALRFETTRAGAIPEGELETDIPARALTAGVAGNVASGAVCVLLSSVPGVARVENLAAFSGGAAAEADESLRTRLLAGLGAPADAANRSYYLGTALAHPAVRAAALAPRARGAGTLDVVVALRAGWEEDALAQLGETYREAREIGTDVLVRAAKTIPAEVAVLVTAAKGFEAGAVCESCRQAVLDHVNRLEIGRPLLLNRLTGCLLGVPGVENFRILLPAGDVIPGELELVVPGDILAEGVASL